MTKRELGPMTSGITVREQRLAAAGRVAAGVLHDMRNVLGPIANLAFVLEKQADDSAKVRDLAARIAGLTQVRSRVADRLRDFLRQDAARFPEGAIVDLAAAARETIALCETLARARAGSGVVTFSCDAPAALPVAGEGADLRTAIFELLLNAIDALPHGGLVEVHARADGGDALLEVRNGSAAIAPAMQESVFDPFVSGKADPDAGLGLSAAWGIARRHGGDLTLDGAEGGRVVAILKLPLLRVENSVQD